MIDELFLDVNGVARPETFASNYSAITCDKLRVNVFERILTRTERMGYVDEGAELITGDRPYATTTPFWIIADGIANLIKFDDMYVSDGEKMTREVGTVLNRVVPMWQYSKRQIISNGTFYEYKWVFNKTQGILMVELTNGDVQYYRSTQQELYASTDLAHYEDGRHDLDNFDIQMEAGDELHVYRDHGVLILTFTVVRRHRPVRPLEYVNAAFLPRPAAVCVFADDTVAAIMAKK